GDHERLDARGRVAPGRGAHARERTQLLLGVLLEERGALEPVYGRAEPDGLQIVGHRLDDRRVDHVGRDRARVEAARIAGLGEQGGGCGRGGGGGRRGGGGREEGGAGGVGAAGRAAGAGVPRVVDRAGGAGGVGGGPAPPVLPRRPGCPLLGERDPLGKRRER